MTYRIALVGTGPSPDEPGRDGFGMAYHHAAGYQRLDDCELVACADIVPEHAAAFAERFDIEARYDDYRTMLEEIAPDIVSVTVPPAVHAEIVLGCAQYGALEAVHCEKPMATTWADCQAMVEACRDADIKLTFNHQRRVGPTYRRAKEILDSGRIGTLKRVECSTKNLFDAGTHVFDLGAMFVEQSTPEWVLASIDYREENRWFGAHNENQAVAHWRYENDVFGIAATGHSAEVVDSYVRLVGTDGVIEIGAPDGPALRARGRNTRGWSTVKTGENMWGDTRLGLGKAILAKVSRTAPWLPDTPFQTPSHIDRAIESVVTAVRTDRESELKATNALQSTELIFASWESVRRRERIDLPLTIGDNPLEAMVEDGMLPVGRTENEVGSDLESPPKTD